jgi:hypothetical protein
MAKWIREIHALSVDRAPTLCVMSDSVNRLKARYAAHVKWAQTDPAEGTAAARAKFMLRFIDAADPNRELPEGERLRRAEHLRKAYFTKLALASAKARRKR